MLNGLATLSYLRRQLLPMEMESETTWDDDLRRIGSGVAGQFETYCNRKFARVTGGTFEVDGGCSLFTVERFPIEQVTALVLVPSGGGTNEDILSTIATTALESGIVRLASVAGTYRDRVRVTYDGGYWINDEATAQPSGSTALPADLLDAWVMQCQAEAEAMGLFKAGAVRSGDERTSLGLLDRVEAILKSYCRMG